MEDEAAALREMQAKVEQEMGAVQGYLFTPNTADFALRFLGSVAFISGYWIMFSFLTSRIILMWQGRVCTAYDVVMV